MSFGWSASDLVAAADFLRKLAKSLHEIDGAPKDFREASSFLNSLSIVLRPLETFVPLESKPVYKSEIEREVKAIRNPVDKFISDVSKLQEDLGTIKEGRFRHLNNIPSKLKWHFSISAKALDLKETIDRHLRIIDTLMQQLTV